MSSAILLNLDQSKILSSGNELKLGFTKASVNDVVFKPLDTGNTSLRLFLNPLPNNILGLSGFKTVADDSTGPRLRSVLPRDTPHSIRCGSNPRFPVKHKSNTLPLSHVGPLT